jgi:peroxiredoxin Q/BCP
MKTVLCAALAAFLLTALPARAAGLPAPGSMAPDFSLTAQEGDTVHLSDMRGKWVVLYFYPKDFSSGCTIEAHGFERDMPRYRALNAEVLGISVDSAESHKGFCAKEGLDFKLLSDSGHEVSALYGSLQQRGGAEIAARNTFIIGPEGKVAKTFTAVQPATHSAEVLAALAELQEGK